MLIFLVPIVIGFLAILLASIGNMLRTGKSGTKFSRWCFSHDTALGASAFFSFALLVIMGIALIVNHVDYASFPAEYRATKSTLTISRIGSTMAIERAAAIHKVIDMNREIASAKYWNDSIWVGWFIPNKVAKLEYIE